MAKAGLGSGWRCRIANDFSSMKAAAYLENWGFDHFVEGDVSKLTAAELPGHPDLVWASTPCQDLSLAGNAAGLGDESAPSTRSGAFWPWWALMQSLSADGRKPRVIVFENVVGALTSNKGADFNVLAAAFAKAGYRFGGMVIDARMFLPQSRPRLFIVGYDAAHPLPAGLHSIGPMSPWHTSAVQAAFDRLSDDVRESWAWWSLPYPFVKKPSLEVIIEDRPTGVRWHSAAETQRILDTMSPANKAKLAQAKALKKRIVGTVYKRTRPVDGIKTVRAEVRFDGVAGCLRTPSGGSSRQTVIVVKGDVVRTRLLSPREAARLMGLPDTYRLPENYNDAYHVCGDGVAVPVVRHLAKHLLEPLADAAVGGQQEFRLVG